MKNKEVKGILALVVVTALSFGVIAGSRALSTDIAGSAGTGETAAALEEYDVSGSETVEKAVRTESGYEVTVRESGYASDIVLRVAFESDASTISSVEVLEQNETESLGSRIAEPEFLDQFKGVAAPVYLPGMTLDDAGSAENAASETEGTASQESLETLEGAALSDGTYTASGQPDSNGYTDQVSITVENGAITAVTWDAVMEDGTSKSVLSENGEYTMTEDGLTWKEQSEALCSALIENQSLSFLNPNEEGKTDAVSGVSISVSGFMNLAQQCLEQAAGIEPQEETLPLSDGTYTASGQPDSNGYTDQVSITVENGAVTAVTWDAVMEDGTSKSVLSENGEYTMTEDGLTWKEQSEALCSALIENQSLSFLNPDEEGKTDAVSGVSISVGGFMNLAQQCLDQAAGVETAEAPAEETAAPQNGTQVDAVSGATRSSTAAVTGINDAYYFLQTVK